MLQLKRASTVCAIVYALGTAAALWWYVHLRATGQLAVVPPPGLLRMLGNPYVLALTFIIGIAVDTYCMRQIENDAGKNKW